MPHTFRPALVLSALTTLAFASLTGACNGHPLDTVEMEIASGLPIEFDFAPRNKVDVLIVLDNSGSMGEEQANLASNFGAFVDVLEAAGADYRLAVTTTDVGGNEWCTTTSPEDGELQDRSCRERLQHFVSQNGATNVGGVACTDICDLETLDFAPTSVGGDPNLAVRPWMQAGGSESNLPEGVSAAEAFRCMAPQGIDGCGFESPLEAMRLALTRMQNVNEPEYGFLREDAELMVMIVTDEVDCSVPAHGQSIFDAQGNKVYWSDPSQNQPTSAICWNAGVQCSGDASGYDDCVSVDRDVDGAETTPDQAVLTPVEDYIAVLDAILSTKAYQRRVHVSLLGGVPQDFAENGLVYADSLDAEFQDKFGIGAGCTSEVGGVTQEAVPPVRMREVVEAFDGTQIFSVCETDYSNALEEVASTLTPGLRGACVEHCLEDQSSIDPGVQPDCRFTEVYPDGSSLDLPECELDADQWVPPADAEACVAYLNDLDGATSSAADDADTYCMPDSGFMAVEVWRAQGESSPVGAQIEATCLAETRPGFCG